MTDDVLMKQLVDVLTDIRHELRFLRAEGMTKPLPHHVCMRCEKKGVPCERIADHWLCVDCLELSIHELALNLNYQKTKLLEKALAAGESSIRIGMPLPPEA